MRNYLRDVIRCVGYIILRSEYLLLPGCFTCSKLWFSLRMAVKDIWHVVFQHERYYGWKYGRPYTGPIQTLTLARDYNWFRNY